MILVKRAIVSATVAGFFLSANAFADEIKLHNENGEAITLDTATLRGCVVVFDQSGAPFEICRMEAVNLAPEATTRRRPGSQEAETSAEIVYRRAEE